MDKQEVPIGSVSEAQITSRVTVVTVTFNSAHIVSEMINSIPSNVEIVVVDNGSSDIEKLRDYAHTYGFTLVENGTNQGFGVACNKGAKIVRSEFILFLNPDAQLKPRCLDEAINAFDRYADCVALNPSIQNRNGTEYFRRGSVLIPKSNWLARGWPAADCKVPVLSGSALFVRTGSFNAIGGFDSNIFLYHEDDDLSFRLLERGNLMFVRAAKVVHLSGESTIRSPKTAAFKALHMGHSRVYVGRKHRVSGAFLKPLLQGALQFISPINLISRRKRAKSTAFLKGVWGERASRISR